MADPNSFELLKFDMPTMVVLFSVILTAIVQLLLCFIQYLPAGYCLCFAYRRSGTIISPIIVHAVVNAMSMIAVTRINYA